MRTIDQRGHEMLDRQPPGHWEGDLIVGSRNRSAIGTLVERTSRFRVSVHFPDDKTVGTVTAGIVQAMWQILGPMRQSFTWDRAAEMAEHDVMTRPTGLAIYFCDSASAWQRHLDENANGLRR